MQLGFDFDSSSQFYVYIFCFEFLEEKYLKQKKQLVHISSRLRLYLSFLINWKKKILTCDAWKINYILY
jgi:hypothetical protein